MPCPTPSDFNDLIVSLEAPVCEQLRKLGRLSKAVSDAYSCIYNEDLTFTTGFNTKLCATGCGGGGGDTNTSTSDPTGPGAAYMATQFLSGGVYRGRLFSLETGGWTYTTISGSMDQVIVGMAVRPNDSTLWAIYFDATGDASPYPLRLGTVNVTTGALTYVDTINSGGSDWDSSVPWIDYYSLEFRPNSTLLMGYWSSPTSTDAQIYSVSTTTAALTAIGTRLNAVGVASYFFPYSLSYDAAATPALHCLGLNAATGDVTTSSVNLTPNPSAGNVIEATEGCVITNTGSSLPAGAAARTYTGLLNKNGKQQIVVRALGDIYEVTNTIGGCSNPHVLKMTGAGSMTDVTAVAGIPS